MFVRKDDIVLFYAIYMLKKAFRNTASIVACTQIISVNISNRFTLPTISDARFAFHIKVAYRPTFTLPIKV